MREPGVGFVTQAGGTDRARRLLIHYVPILCAAAALLWLVLDFSIPRRHSLRNFNPHRVAQIETGMWRSYYDHHSLQLFFEMAQLLRSQYHLSITRSWAAGYYAAHAAVVFQRGQSRPDYEKALPDLVAYYSLIRAGSDTPFNLQEVARLELEWWIVHRQRAHHPAGDLPQSLAALQAAIYNEPAEQLSEHAQARGDAMIIRDKRAASGGVSDADWNQINRLLNASWVSLKNVVAQ
jgi:hypothetical protein